MQRKDFLKLGLSAAAASAIATSCVPEDRQGYTSTTDAPNVITGRRYQFKMVTTWPPKFPVLGEVADLYAEWVRVMSGGRIEIKVYGGGEYVPALEAFDAVSRGAAEMGCGAAYYWAGKSPATQFFAAVPFGMNAQQLTAWLLHGGGLELWREVYAAFDLVPYLGGNTGVQMGGWYNRAIETTADFKGLKMRMPGLGGKVLERAGGTPVLIAGSEIYTSLERGVIDATEWIGPYHDYKMGFHKIAKYYYYPGWHEPGSNLEFFVNKTLHDSLPLDLQAILEAAALRAHSWVLAAFDAQNGFYLDKILTESPVQLRAFPKAVLEDLRRFTAEAIEAEVGKEALSRRVYDSYRQFAQKAKAWSVLTEQAYYDGVMG